MKNRLTEEQKFFAEEAVGELTACLNGEIHTAETLEGKLENACRSVTHVYRLQKEKDGKIITPRVMEDILFPT